MESESVLDIAMMIRAKAEVIANATVEADMHAAVDQIAAGVDRMRAIM